MSEDTYKVHQSLIKVQTLASELITLAELCDSGLHQGIIKHAGITLKNLAITMQNRLNNAIELNTGVKFQKCEIEDYKEYE